MDYTKLPKQLHAKVIEMFNSYDVVGLLQIHNEYKLTPYSYNCCGIDGMMDWFRYGIENGKIKTD